MASTAVEAQQRLQAAEAAVKALEAGLAPPDSADAAIGRARDFVDNASAPTDVMTRGKLSGVRQELDVLGRVVDGVRRRSARAAQAQLEREQLSRRLNPAPAPSAADLAAAEGHLGREHDALRHCRGAVQRMTEENGAVLSALQGQRRRMEGTGAKMEGVMRGLGVSDEAILQIRRMSATDRFIVCMGVFFLLVLMGYLWFF